jgi:hypothetical protein
VARCLPWFINENHADAFLKEVRLRIRQAGRVRYPEVLRYVATRTAYRVQRDAGETKIYDVRSGVLLLKAGRGRRATWCRIHGAES